MKPRLNATAVFALAVTAVTNGCATSGVLSREPVTLNFALRELDRASGRSLVMESAEGRVTREVVPPQVFEVGFNDRFIIVAREPWSVVQGDADTTQYYVVTVVDGAVFGPADRGSFQKLRAQLGVPLELGFSKNLLMRTPFP